MMKIENLDRFERETLLRFLLYTMQPDIRRRIMSQYPVIYRKLLGREVTSKFESDVRAVVLDEVIRPGDVTRALIEEAAKTGSPIILDG